MEKQLQRNNIRGQNIRRIIARSRGQHSHQRKKTRGIRLQNKGFSTERRHA